MPLKNDKDTIWTAWLVDGADEQADELRDALITELRRREIPGAGFSSGTVNMWNRSESLYVDVTSELDGRVVVTIHLQPYGTSLFVGRAVDSSRQGNYYRRMATAAFLMTVDRTIDDVLVESAGEPAVHTVEYSEGRTSDRREFEVAPR